MIKAIWPDDRPDRGAEEILVTIAPVKPRITGEYVFSVAFRPVWRDSGGTREAGWQ
jgi:hypothetical protein